MNQSEVKIAGYTLPILMKHIIYGVAVGDALGFPMQFKSRDYASRHPIVDMGKYRSGHEYHKYLPQIIGLWSDDTSLTLCLAESLASGYDLGDMAQKNYAWLSEGYRSALPYAFDIGRQCAIGIPQAKELADKNAAELPNLIKQNIVNANGNGALMRILPLLIKTYGQDIDTAYQYVKEVSALTHPHIRSVFCCLYYLRFAERILNKMDKHEAFEEIQKEMYDFSCRIPITVKDAMELMRLIDYDIAAFDSNNVDNPSNYLHSSGYVVHSLEAALWCILNNESFEETLLAAVKLGEDTDSIAAIAGGVAALLYGFEEIPANWIDLLQSKEEIEAVLALYQG
ncbi:MAG: ADP-ribosylglycohydrolase family protein [Candidatus Cloacimonadaceae bacterium]